MILRGEKDASDWLARVSHPLSLALSVLPQSTRYLVYTRYQWKTVPSNYVSPYWYLVWVVRV